jgi:pyruvate carboxylase subunit B
MKMENDIESEFDGVIENIFVEEGDSIGAGDILMIIK